MLPEDLMQRRQERPALPSLDNFDSNLFRHKAIHINEQPLIFLHLLQRFISRTTLRLFILFFTICKVQELECPEKLRN